MLWYENMRVVHDSANGTQLCCTGYILHVTHWLQLQGSRIITKQKPKKEGLQKQKQNWAD